MFNSFLSKKQDKKDYESAKKIQYKMRKRHGIGYTLHMLEYAKDIRLFNGGSFMIDKFMTFQADVDKDARELNIYGNKFSFIKSISNSVFELMLYVYVVLQVITNGMQIGDMTIFTSSARQFKSSISHLMKSYVEISNNVYKYDEYKNFMSIPLHKYECGNKKPVVDGNSEIEFRDVWFKYPGTDRYILKNFNLKFNLNQKLCIVGVNGVGKSTFVKLLVRFYAPTKGEILLNGININEYGFDDYLQLFTAAFQDSKAFYFTIAENIAFSNDYDIDKINDVCKFCDLSTLINKLSEGYDTQVGKWIESAGIDFSGGELQKMLIARAAYHDSYIYLLDEPTAALDPMAEYDIYSTFDKMVKGKCAIFITHRLSAVQLADKVAVFDDGRVAEYGTHNELYAKGGIYTEMFDKQAQFYRDTQSEESESDTAV